MDKESGATAKVFLRRDLVGKSGGKEEMGGRRWRREHHQMRGTGRQVRRPVGIT